MRTRNLPGTDISTTPLGLGCATLFHLPRPSDRRALLWTAFDAGIRHYDVAPMYGFGHAESELGDLLRGHREKCTITTKFGIDPSIFGRMAGGIQGPARAWLNRVPQVAGGLKSSGRTPDSGLVGRLLYTSKQYAPNAVRRSLDRSLLALATDYVDLFMVHDPTESLLLDGTELTEYLATEVASGRIRSWGVASDTNIPTGEIRAFTRASPVLQVRDDIFEEMPDANSRPGQAVVTFGIMERALPALTAHFIDSSEECDLWSNRFGFDVAQRGALPNLLVRQAIYRNQTGPVLYSSTRPERVIEAARQADLPKTVAALADEAQILKDLTAAIAHVDEPLDEQ